MELCQRPRAQMVRLFLILTYNWLEGFAKIFKVPGAQRNVNPARSITWFKSQSNLSLYSSKTSKRVTSLRGLSPRHCARATQLLSKNAAMANRWQHCVQFDRPEI